MNPPSSAALWRSPRRLYLDKNGQVVTPESTEKPHTLLVGENGEIPLERAKALGLVEGYEPAPEAAPEAEEIDLDALAKAAGKELVDVGAVAALTADRDAKAADLAREKAAVAATVKQRDDAKSALAAAKSENADLKKDLATATKERDELKKAAAAPQG